MVARRLELLERLAGELGSRYPALKIAVEAADLSDPEGYQRLLRWLEEGGRDVDVLVNSAGLGESELFENSRWSRILQMIDVNILALLRLTHSLLSEMIARGHRAILNIGSGAGYATMPNPCRLTYAAGGGQIDRVLWRNHSADHPASALVIRHCAALTEGDHAIPPTPPRFLIGFPG